jgi:hypothetical protein
MSSNGFLLLAWIAAWTYTFLGFCIVSLSNFAYTEGELGAGEMMLMMMPWYLKFRKQGAQVVTVSIKMRYRRNTKI